MTHDAMGLADFWESTAGLDDSRPTLATLAVRPSETTDDTMIEVVLLWQGRWATGRAITRSSDDVAEAAAAAAVESIGQFLPAGWKVRLEVLDTRRPPSVEVTIANAVVTCASDEGDETFVGAALVRSDARVAAVRATLAAMNRRLARLRQEP